MSDLPPGHEQAEIPGTESEAVSAAESLESLAALAQAKADAGEHVPHHLARALRERWLYSQRETLWPGIEAAAQDLGMSAQTLRNYRKQGAPIPKNDPIPKSPLFRWLWERERDRLEDMQSKRRAARDLADEADAQLKIVKAQAASGELVAEAEDRARQGIVQAIGSLRRELVHDLPARLATEAEHRAAGAIEDLLRAELNRALRSIDPTPTEKDPTP